MIAFASAVADDLTELNGMVFHMIVRERADDTFASKWTLPLYNMPRPALRAVSL